MKNHLLCKVRLVILLNKGVELRIRSHKHERARGRKCEWAIYQEPRTKNQEPVPINQELIIKTVVMIDSVLTHYSAFLL